MSHRRFEASNASEARTVEASICGAYIVHTSIEWLDDTDTQDTSDRLNYLIEDIHVRIEIVPVFATDTAGRIGGSTTIDMSSD